MFSLTARLLNIVPLTAVAKESSFYANVNMISRFAKNVLMKLVSQY